MAAWMEKYPLTKIAMAFAGIAQSILGGLAMSTSIWATLVWLIIGCVFSAEILWKARFTAKWPRVVKGAAILCVVAAAASFT